MPKDPEDLKDPATSIHYMSTGAKNVKAEDRTCLAAFDNRTGAEQLARTCWTCDQAVVAESMSKQGNCTGAHKYCYGFSRVFARACDFIEFGRVRVWHDEIFMY